MAELRENHIEWYSGADTMTLSLTQAKYINRVRGMVEKYPEIGSILAENPDGSVLAHISLRALHLTYYGQNTGDLERLNKKEAEVEVTT